MDRITIKDLEVFAFHGVFNQEKEMGQRFLISLELFLDLQEAGDTDDLNKTINYSELCHSIDKQFKEKKYDLIETAAEKLAEFILTEYDTVSNIKVMIKKPWAPIGLPIDYAAVEIEKSWHKSYIGIGSNMGNKEDNIKEAIALINNSKDCKVLKTSSFYTTKPVGYLEQDDFLNCAIEIKTTLTPIKLVRFLLMIEKELKRERIVRWGPRTIDLDVLLYDNIVSSDEEIIIPHPRMHERYFVLKPLNEIAPYALHPLLNKRIFQIYNELTKKE